MAKITFKGKVVREGLLVNYNLEDEELEISTTEGIKIVPAGFISSWEVGERVFVSLFGSKDECIRSEKAYGEVLTESGDLILMKVYNLEKRNPVYNEKLGIGDNNYRYTRSDQILLLHNAKCLDISGSASRREKNILHFLKNQKISKLVQEQKFDLKQEADLIALVEQVAQNM